MTATYRKPNVPDDPGENVVILRNAVSGDRDFTDASQVLVKFGDGSERAVPRECLSGLVGQELPPEPPKEEVVKHKMTGPPPDENARVLEPRDTSRDFDRPVARTRPEHTTTQKPAGSERAHSARETALNPPLSQSRNKK